MYQVINCSILTAYKISKSKKMFFCYTLDKENNKVKEYILTNDLRRYRNQYTNFKLVEIIQTNINTIQF